MNSILNTVKKLLGISKDYTHFDEDIKDCINTTIVYLKQLGVSTGIDEIEDETATWSDLLGDTSNLQPIKIYIFHKVRLMFDPPSNSSVRDAIEKNLSELEWRINTEVDV